MNQGLIPARDNNIKIWFATSTHEKRCSMSTMNNEHYDERASVIDHSEDSNPNILSEKMPENATNVDEIDSIIAQQMMKLSVEDREKVYSDVHGVKEGKKENEEMIQDGLDSMQREIEKLQHKEAYDMACTKDQKYVESRSFQLAFLRADSFDARKAAIRFVRHFQVKLDLFGEEKLVMDIVQDDLDRDTMGALYSGTGQILDTTDSAGRCIIAAVFGAPWTTRAYLQRAFYNTMMTIRDPYKQIHGYIIVVYSLAHSSQQGDASKHYTITKISEGLPDRIEALHLCHDSPKGQVLLTASKAAANPSMKIRARTHCGTNQQIMLSLAGYGIKPGTIPVGEGCKITNLDAYQQRLHQMRSIERLKEPKRQKINVPSRSDILFGKGTPFQNHHGNVQLRNMVSERYKAYAKAATKGQKMQITKEIVQTVQQNSGLFLRPDGGSWVCVEEEAARQKVSALFRSLRIRMGDT
mmetsp:Transcript_35084/g.84971  ORF Transcript_35084/g.84971 Transcript_35084/m.84971 type:complete len:468 (-) Transcript_35084:1301-2704(-)